MIIAWDFDGVLNLNHDGRRYVWEDAFLDAVGQPAADFGAFVFSSATPQVLTGQIDILDRLEAWTQAVPCKMSAAEILAFWLEQDARPDARMIAMVDRLKTHGTRQIITTNNEARRAAYISEQMGFGARMERVFASGPMGVAKPDPGYYTHVADAMKVPPGDLVLIDDKPENVEAAIASGWQGFHFTEARRETLLSMLEAHMSPNPALRLATYGTLAPGQVNHHHMGGMSGLWSRGTIHGHLHAEGWGAKHDCPGIHLAPDGEEVAVHIFTSPDLPDHWARLDAFEGAEYRRVSTMADTPDGPLPVSIYQLASAPGAA
ncbi:MAG: HAD-IA family hydrolase [Pseudomonadota bacterium]